MDAGVCVCLFVGGVFGSQSSLEEGGVRPAAEKGAHQEQTEQQLTDLSRRTPLAVALPACLPLLLLQGMVCGLTQAAVDESVRRTGGVVEGVSGPAANFPIPSLYGSPFTTLAVTQTYFSLLHVEPNEHPFSYITWLDVLAPGSTLEVMGVRGCWGDVLVWGDWTAQLRNS